MARFRAYTSDSSDEESASERETSAHHATVNDEADSDRESSSSSSSDLHEHELVVSPARKVKPTRNALVEDEDGEIHYAHEAHHDRTRPTVRVSPPRRSRGDPTIIPWAQHIGVDAQKMHVMQTSLFRMPEEAAALKAQKQPIRPQLRIPPQSLNRKHSRESEGDSLRLESREVGCPVCSLREHTQTYFFLAWQLLIMLFAFSAHHSLTTLSHCHTVLHENMPVSKVLHPLLVATKVRWSMPD